MRVGLYERIQLSEAYLVQYVDYSVNVGACVSYTETHWERDL